MLLLLLFDLASCVLILSWYESVSYLVHKVLPFLLLLHLGLFLTCHLESGQSFLYSITLLFLFTLSLTLLSLLLLICFYFLLPFFILLLDQQISLLLHSLLSVLYLLFSLLFGFFILINIYFIKCWERWTFNWAWERRQRWCSKRWQWLLFFFFLFLFHHSLFLCLLLFDQHLFSLLNLFLFLKM